MGMLVDFEREYQYYLRDDEHFVAFDIRNVAAFQEMRNAVLEERRSAWRDGLVTRAEYRRAASLPVAPRDDVYRLPANALLIPIAEQEAANADEENAVTVVSDDRKQLARKAAPDIAQTRRAALWKAVDDISLAWEPQFGDAAVQAFEVDRRNIMRIITAAQKAAYRTKATINWTRAGQEVQDYLLNAAQDNWRETFIPILTALITEQATQQAVEYGLQFDVVNLLSGAWFDEYVAKFADEITRTSWNEMAEIFQRAQLEGWSIPTVADNLEVLFDQWTTGTADPGDTLFAERRLPPYRRVLIARDQVVKASNAGNFQLYQAWDVPRKMWLSTPDNRTRAAHSAIDVDGQIRDIDQPFDVGGEQLMYPGDSSLGASLGNVIQCRCTTVPIFAGEEFTR